jgi:hypothetical protein
VAEFISLVTLFAIAIAVLYILDLQQGTKNNAKTEPVWIYAEFITEVLTVVFLALLFYISAVWFTVLLDYPVFV